SDPKTQPSDPKAQPSDPKEPASPAASAPPATRTAEATATFAKPTKPIEPPEMGAEVPELPRAERGISWSLGFGPSLALGVAPQPTGIGRIFVVGSARTLSLEIAADAAIPVTQQEVDGSSFSVERFSVSIAPCAHAGPFAGCLT